MKRFLVLWLILIACSWYPVHAARTFVAASSHYLEVSSALLSTQTGTIAAWAMPVGTALVYNVVTIGNSANANMYLALRIRDGGQGQAAVHDGTFSAAQTSNTATANAWNHVVAIFNGDSSRTAILNGDIANKGTNTTTRGSLSGLNRTRIASHHTGTPRFDGRLEHIAVWNEALTDAEAASLWAGAHPDGIRPHARVSSVPIWGIQSPEIDLWAPRSWTLNGTPAQAAGAPMGFMGRRRP